MLGDDPGAKRNCTVLACMEVNMFLRGKDNISNKQENLCSSSRF